MNLADEPYRARCQSDRSVIRVKFAEFLSSLQCYSWISGNGITINHKTYSDYCDKRVGHMKPAPTHSVLHLLWLVQPHPYGGILSTSAKDHFRRDLFPIQPHNGRGPLLRNAFGFDGPSNNSPPFRTMSFLIPVISLLASFSHKGHVWYDPNGRHDIYLFCSLFAGNR